MAWSFQRSRRTRLALPLVFFFVIGMGITVASAVSYWLLADLVGIDPNLALLLVFVVFTLVGFAAHGSITFGNYAHRGSRAGRLVRYALVSLSGLIVNEFFILLLVKWVRGAVWWPVIPMVLVTPWLLFAFNRFWVFPEESK